MSDPFEVVRHPTARRVRLSIDPASGRARLVLPRRAALKPALAWARGKADWIAEQQARLPSARPYAPGMVLTVADQPSHHRLAAGQPPRVEVVGDTLSLSGPLDTLLPRRVETWLKRTAPHQLAERHGLLCGQAGVIVTKVAIGDARGRWGSCAVDGVIRYSWR